MKMIATLYHRIAFILILVVILALYKYDNLFLFILLALLGVVWELKRLYYKRKYF